MTRCFLRVLLPMSLLAAPCGAAVAEPNSEAKTTVISAAVELVGTVSVAELARQAAMAPPKPTGRPPVELLKHLLPDGSSTAAPRSSVLQSLPSLSSNVRVVSATTNTGFAGVTSYGNGQVNGVESEPPDQGLAVSNSVVAAINNQVVQFFNLANGLANVRASAALALSSFFQNNNSCGDPQVFFDPTIPNPSPMSPGRWFFTEIESSYCTTRSPAIEGFDVAVSQSSDPADGYYVYHIEAVSSDLFGCGGWDCLPDYPKAGYDANGFYISANLWNVSTGRFVAAATYALPKSQLAAGVQPPNYVRVLYPGDFVVQPSVPAPGEPFVAAANGVEYLMEARNIWDGSSNVRVWAISNTSSLNSSNPALRGVGVDIQGASYGATAPSTEPNVVGSYCRSVGVKSAPSLDAGYNAFQATIQMAGGKLFGVLPFGSKDGAGLARDALAWFAVTPSPSVDVSGQFSLSASIFSQGYVVPPNGYSISYPAFGLNRSGAGVLGFSIANKSQSAPGGFPSAAYVAFTGTGVAGSIVVTGQGVASDDGFTGCTKPGPGGVGRWGDYGAATVDAATGLVYTANEDIPGRTGVIGLTGSSTNWGTFITQLNPNILTASQ